MSAGVPAAAGAELPRRVVGPLAQTDVLRFAGACGDFNPLHHDRAVAARAGFAAPVAMGQMTAGIVAAWITDWCGVERLRDLEVRFLAPVLVGDTLTLTGGVESDEDGRGTAPLAVEGSTGDTVVLTARAVIGPTPAPETTERSRT
ncbi:MaoC/PaaZ C-terminal domain-containing protein [Pseudonocardia sp. NPDC049154]|uniref:MaoC family dehydratase n=1 Tax=Pseudonocardia sp. NPDC049154 TaxID=3155501 RepID=UPI0033E827ED